MKRHTRWKREHHTMSRADRRRLYLKLNEVIIFPLVRRVFPAFVMPEPYSTGLPPESLPGGIFYDEDAIRKAWKLPAGHVYPAHVVERGADLTGRAQRFLEDWSPVFVPDPLLPETCVIEPDYSPLEKRIIAFSLCDPLLSPGVHKDALPPFLLSERDPKR